MLRATQNDLASGVGRPKIWNMTATGRLDESQLTAWRRFLQAHAVLVRRLEADLLAEHRLPLASYDVLVQLVEAPGHRLRMTELAQRVLISRSGLTRLVDRLEREGLVRREACDDDARGLFAVLTDDGYTRLRRAAPTHLRGVASYALDRLDEEQTRALAEICARLLGDAAVTPAVSERLVPPARDSADRALRPSG
jgi:DNA-binding MarR family transcriptional regulator